MISGPADVAPLALDHDRAVHGRPLCALHLALGRREECPGPACAFWEEGGAIVEPGCVFERITLELEARPELAKWLLGMRSSLESANTAAEKKRLRIALEEVLPADLHE